MRTMISHYHNTVRADFLENKFSRMRWFFTECEKNARKYYRHTEFVVIDETLRNLHTLYNCDFKSLYGRQTWKLWSFISCISRCTRSICFYGNTYVTPPINNPEKKGNIHDLVMEFSKIF